MPVVDRWVSFGERSSVILLIRCPKCGREFNAREASPYNIKEGSQGEDVVTFTCPYCQAQRVQFTVRRKW